MSTESDGIVVDVSRLARSWVALVLLNASLAFLIQLSAPSAPRTSDRQAYEYVGEHAFAPDCGWSIYCYRVLAPATLNRLPGDWETRWRWYQVAAVAVAGAIVSLMMTTHAGVFAGVLTGILAQTNYGFTFTAYDPYTADPLVFVFAAAIAWCWLADRPKLALLLGLVGIFAKETVALVSASCLLAALARSRSSWRSWVISGISVCTALLAYRWTMDTYFGWGVSSNPAANFASGSWLAIWWENNPFLVRKLFLLFAPFGFAWLFAALNYRVASPALRHLALGAIAPFLALCYVQTPERALANAFFVVVPLAAVYIARVPVALGLAAAIANGVLTTKVGSSTEWLPSSAIVMLPTLLLALAVIWWSEATRRLHDGHETPKF